VEKNQFRRFYVVNSEKINVNHRLAKGLNVKMRLWDYMVRNMKGWNSLTLIQTEAAKEIDVSVSYLCKILKELEGMRLIVKNGKSQQNNIYMISPYEVWNGEAKDHLAGQAKFSKLFAKYDNP
jgi:hypothetical protein